MQEAHQDNGHIVATKTAQLEVGRQTTGHQLLADLLRVDACKRKRSLVRYISKVQQSH